MLQRVYFNSASPQKLMRKMLFYSEKSAFRQRGLRAVIKVKTSLVFCWRWQTASMIGKRTKA